MLSAKKDFWDDPEKARWVLQRKTKLSDSLEKWKTFKSRIRETETLCGLASEEKDEAVLLDLAFDLEHLSADVREEELKMMLSSEQDPMNAIMSIHAGAGGTEAQDWVEMLLRMYLRWAEKRNFKTSVIDYLPGDEAGVKSVTFTVEGEYAYGYAKAEIGIHRLVRISPFDAGEGVIRLSLPFSSIRKSTMKSESTSTKTT